MPENVKKLLSKEPAIKNAIKDEQIFHAVGMIAYPKNSERGAMLTISVPIAISSYPKLQGIIPVDEADADRKNIENLNYLVGTDIPFVIIGVDDERNVLICSRRIAQQKNKAAMLADFTKGKAFEGRITGFSDFGAYVSVDGVSGILRNSDYATDHSRIISRYKVGDRISVKCKSITTDENARISWEAVVKYHRTSPIVCDVEPGVVATGKVIDIRTFPQSQGIFVQLDNNTDLDVLCSMPSMPEIEKGVSVVIIVTSVKPAKSEFEPPMIRGRVLGLSQ